MIDVSDPMENEPPGNRPGRSHRGRTTSGLVACLAVAGATIIASGCSGGTSSTQAAGGTTTTMVATSTSTTKRAAPITTPASSTPSARPVSAGATSLPFVADTNPDISAATDGAAVLVSVTKGNHDGYVRYVFLFRYFDPDGHQPWREWARPAWDARYVPASEAVMDGSGRPVTNVGAKAHLRIRFNASMHNSEGDSTLQTSVSDQDALAFGGDFEGIVRWFYGSAQERPFRVDYVGDGRVAVDIVT